MDAGFSAAIPTSARAFLVAWANQQGGWVRLLVSEVLVSSAPVAESYLQEVYIAFLIENALAPGDPLPISSLNDSEETKDEVQTLLLTKLDELEGVNALTAGQSIDFNSKLTIVFGQNASGKTGYVRVLKMAAAVRKVEKVLHDVSGTVKAAGAPTALISFRLGDNDDKVRWRNESGLAPFTRIDVFDSSATNLHVDEDLNYVYTPAELARFPRAQRGIEWVKAKLESAIADASKITNPFTSFFTPGNRAYALIESLGPITDLAAVRALTFVEKTERETIDPLKLEIDALKSSKPELYIRAATELKQKFESLAKAISTLAEIDAGSYTEAVARVASANQQHEAVTRSSFAGLTIPGLLQDAWKEFIQAGEEYLRATVESENYPSTESNCIYCQQLVSAPAIDLLRKYRDFCNNAFRSELTEAQQKLDAIITPLRSKLNFPDVLRQLSEILVALPQLSSG